MMPNLNEEAVFNVARHIEAPEGRRLYLQQSCGEDRQLLARVEALLRVYDQEQSFLQAPADGLHGTLDEPAGAAAGTIVGPYKLLQQIGEGGMGTVFMAEQTHPVQRKVALKIIKPGMDSRQVIARFEAERQALALMDHPNIAMVLDAGTTGGEPAGASPGRPYFVMELVKGLPITRYCDERHLSPRERLELFVPVCQAVQHAHQKGIIHRDLKPSNVLVALYDGKPVPKVIDFGVAKATGPKLTDRTLYTEFGAIIGTLEYMSPEQAEINQLDIDTRSDIYSLGVLLYELLTGTTPLERKRLKESALLEALRLIREEEPPRPSTRLSTAAELPTIAANRGAEPGKLRRLMRGELDWIVMKALEKDRSRRYETANGLAMDIQRYLQDEPVLACPPSVAYRFQKFARRNKRLLATAGAILLALVVSLAWVWQERQEAVRQRQEAVRQRDLAQDQRLKAHQAVNDYFTLVSEDALLHRPDLEPLRKQLLQSALRYYEGFVREHGDDPELQAELAATYLRICLLTHTLDTEEDWLPAFQKGVALVENLLARQAGAPAVPSLERGIFWINTGVGFHVQRPDECLRAFEKARDVWEELIRTNPAPGLRNDLALFYLVIGMLHEGPPVGPAPAFHPEEAVPALRRSCDLLRQLIQTNPSVPYHRGMLAISLGNLGMSYAARGQLAEAEKACRDALETAKQLVAEFPAVAGWRDLLTSLTCGHFACVMEHAGRLAEAEAVLRLAVNDQEALSRDYPTVTRFSREVCKTRLWLSGFLWEMGRRKEAAEEYSRGRALGEKLNQEDSQTGNVLAWFLATGPDPQFRDARRALEIAKRNVERAPEDGWYKVTLGAASYGTGDYQAAVRALDEALRLPGGNDSVTLFFLAMAHWQLGEKEQARRYFDEAVRRMEKHALRTMVGRRLRIEAERLLGVNQERK
jgi:serine/threonine protein kinase